MLSRNSDWRVVLDRFIAISSMAYSIATMPIQAQEILTTPADHTTSQWRAAAVPCRQTGKAEVEGRVKGKAAERAMDLQAIIEGTRCVGVTSVRAT